MYVKHIRVHTNPVSSDAHCSALFYFEIPGLCMEMAGDLVHAFEEIYHFDVDLFHRANCFQIIKIN